MSLEKQVPVKNLANNAYEWARNITSLQEAEIPEYIHLEIRREEYVQKLHFDHEESAAVFNALIEVWKTKIERANNKIINELNEDKMV